MNTIIKKLSIRFMFIALTLAGQSYAADSTNLKNAITSIKDEMEALIKLFKDAEKSSVEKLEALQDSQKKWDIKTLASEYENYVTSLLKPSGGSGGAGSGSGDAIPKGKVFDAGPFYALSGTESDFEKLKKNPTTGQFSQLLLKFLRLDDNSSWTGSQRIDAITSRILDISNKAATEFSDVDVNLLDTYLSALEDTISNLKKPDKSLIDQKMINSLKGMLEPLKKLRDRID